MGTESYVADMPPSPYRALHGLADGGTPSPSFSSAELVGNRFVISPALCPSDVITNAFDHSITSREQRKGLLLATSGSMPTRRVLYAGSGSIASHLLSTLSGDRTFPGRYALFVSRTRQVHRSCNRRRAGAPPDLVMPHKALYLASTNSAERAWWSITTSPCTVTTSTTPKSSMTVLLLPPSGERRVLRVNEGIAEH